MFVVSIETWPSHARIVLMSTPLVIEHFDYILLYRGDREALSGSLDRIQRAASVILKAVSVEG